MEWPIMMLAALQLFLLARDGEIDRVEGVFLLAAMVAFTAYAVWLGRHSASQDEERASRRWSPPRSAPPAVARRATTCSPSSWASPCSPAAQPCSARAPWGAPGRWGCRRP